MSVPVTTLVLGGARSGKSAFAECLVANSGLKRVYLATGAAGDEEMRARIDRHRARRGENWRTIEEPLAIIDALAREAAPHRAILIDCLTLWLSNLMHANRDSEREIQRLAAALRAATSPIVLVSNEVGLGIVPETPLGRRFRDAQGRLNQAIAATAGNVALIVAGLPLWLKRTP